MDWYALFVETGKEHFVKEMIHKRFNKAEINAIVPKRKLQERKQGKIYEVCKTMFPGYVFVQTSMNITTYYRLKEIPKCFRLLNNCKYDDSNENRRQLLEDNNNTQSNDLFSKVDPKEMERIIRLLGNDEVIDYSKVYVLGSNVKIYSGPLKGLEGIIKKIDKRKKRAKIALDFMGKEQLLDIGIEILESN